MKVGLTYDNSEWDWAGVYRCSINDKIYIVGPKVGQTDQTVEILDWDGTVTLGNDGYPTTLSISFGDYQRGDSSQPGEFYLQLESTVSGYVFFGVFLHPYFSDGCILKYAEDGWLVNIQWMD